MNHFRLSICWLVIALGAGAALAQNITGTILGAVTDASGAVVPSAAVTITNKATNQVTTVTTDEDGLYQAPLLQPGQYQVKVVASGFRTSLREEVTLNVEDKLRLDFALEAGQVTEAVTVTGTPLVQTEAPTLGQVITERSIKELPIKGRNVFDLVGLSPNVQVNPRTVGAVATGGGLFIFSDISINGGRFRTNEFLLDGVTLLLPENNNFALSPTPDGTQEFKVITNSYGPQFGRSGGGVINVITKSGSNEFHGTAYELFRNDKLAANNFFSNARGLKRGVYRFNLFGGAVGGPVFKDKTFFFGEYQGHRQTQTLGGQFTTMPTVAQRMGDFRGLLNAQGQPVIIYDPFTTRPNPNGSGFIRDQISCNGVLNVICPNRIDPVAARILTYLPAPTGVGTGPAQIDNYAFAPVSRENSDQWSARIDHRFSEKHGLFGRATRNVGVSIPPRPYNTPADPVSDRVVSRAFNFVLNDTYTFKPTLLLNTRYGFTRRFEGRNPISQGLIDQTKDLGVLPKITSVLPGANVFPLVTLSGYTNIGQGYDALWRGNDIHALVADTTLLQGRHSIIFGGDFRLYNQTPFQPLNNDAGAYSFGNNFTQGPNPFAASTTAGNSLASFLLGYGSGSVSVSPRLAIRNYYLAFYVNDDIKFRNLTLNLGLRYDYEQPRTERYNRFTTFDFDAPFPIQVPGLSNLRGVLTRPGQNGEPRGNFDAATRNFGPRIGLAYRINNKTAVRAGYGIFFLPRIGATSPNTLGVLGAQYATPWVSSLDGITPLNPLSNPFPGPVLVRPTSQVDLLQVGQGGNVTDRNNKTNAYTQHWNLSIQRELAKNTVIEVAYAGNRGVRLPVPLNFNQLDPKFQSLGVALTEQVPNPFFGLVQTGILSNRTVSRAQLLRPFPQYAGLATFQQNASFSSYHSFTLRGEKRFSQGYNLLVAYTGSKLIENASNRIFGYTSFTPPVQNAYNLAAEKSLGDGDVARRLVISHTFDLPFGRGRALLSNASGLVERLIGGWSISGVGTFHSGYPLGLTSNGDPGTFSAVLRPNLKAEYVGRSAELSGDVQTRLNKFFDINAFSIPAPFTFGNVSRTLPDVRGPGRRNYDLTLSKNILLKEPFSLMFRAEAFNLTNTPYFLPPGTNLGSANFGVVSAALNERQVQFTVKLLF
jgi:hypothetical protein